MPSLRRFLFNTPYDWSYVTENDGRINQACDNGSIPWARGKMLGGSSSMNSMIYVKGHPLDYQNWYDQGKYNWHPDVAFEYIRKAESLRNPTLLQYPDVRNFYGSDGPIIVDLFNHTSIELYEKIIESYEELGFGRVRDLNFAKLYGSGYITSNAANGERFSMVRSHLNPVKDRINLHILKSTLVTKIIIDPITNTAVGVVAERRGRIVRYFATKEIIISAGVINSPQLLMLSGIGPKVHLESLGINCIVDSSGVGQNLQDHVYVPLNVFGDEPGFENIADTHFHAVRYLYDRSGSFGEYTDTVMAFFSELESNKYSEYQSHVAIYNKNTSYLPISLKVHANYKQSVIDSIVDENINHALYMFRFCVSRPYSKGNLTLRSNNPHEKPIIYPNYYIDERDLEKTVRGIMKLLKILDTTYFKSINAYVPRTNIEACNQLELNSEEYFRCFSLNMVMSVFHPMGTCKMGPDPKTAVVDNDLKVYGVEKLRVIDASIMPNMTTGNINVPVIMIGERGADLVKNTYGRAD